MTGGGGECSCASVLIFRSPLVFASINITGLRTVISERASPLSRVAMPSLDARHLNASSSLPTRSIHGSFQPAAKSGWHGSRPSSLRKSERRQAVSIGCSTQIEFCDNLIFRRRAALDNLGERLLDD